MIAISSTVSQATGNITSNNTAQALQHSFQIYQNPNLGTRMQYPTDWQIQEENPNITNATTVAFFSPLKDSGLRIVVGEIQEEQEPLGLQNISSQQIFLDASVRNLIDRFSI
jgi:hypothetical protein